MYIKSIIVTTCFIVILGGAYFGFTFSDDRAFETHSVTATEPGFEAMPDMPELMDIPVGAPGTYTISELQNWERPAGPPRVGLQVGHFNNQSMPEELANLERNTGAVWGGMVEADVNMVIAELVKERLEAEGVVVDLLEAAVPPGYQADVFASIHADGNSNTEVNGFKFAAPRRDYTGTASVLVDELYAAYGAATGLQVDSNITRRMTAYYAFNWPRYEYAIHPFTTAVIIETGFLTSPIDRQVIVDQPQLAAQGIVDGILAYLNNDVIDPAPQPTAFVSQALPITGDVICAPLREEWLQRIEGEQCQPALLNDQGQALLLASYSSTTLEVGQPFTADGEYVPAQSIPTYFWFPYDVVGVIVDRSMGMVDSWYLRSRR